MRTERSSALARISVVSILSSAAARLKYPCGHATASSGQDDGHGPSVLPSNTLDEALDSEADDEADGARVGQAQHGTTG